MNLMTTADIVANVFRAGVVGAGGAGFPAHVKLQAKVDTILANGSECEPLLASDKTLMKRHAALIVQGVKIAMQATGAKDGIIAVKGHYEDVVAALEEAVKTETDVRIHQLENYYPAGDEFLTVYDVTGRIIPEGGLPLNVGVVVSNVLTLKQIAEACAGKPVTERYVTVTGALEIPCVVQVPIGTSYQSLLDLAGGVGGRDVVVMDGGPMMGKIVENLQAGIAKTTSGMMVLPREHMIVRMNTMSLSQMIQRSKAACCQCYRCTDLCPRNLLGHALYPHKTMRTIDYNLSDATQHITSAFLCSQCGVCELVACDFMQLSPRKIYAAYREELVKRGIKNPHTAQPAQVASSYEDRKVSIDTVMKKLNLVQYKKETPYLGFKDANEVSIRFDKHVGIKSEPKVGKGQRVQKGDVIAACPKDKLGAYYHASISGEVAEVTDNTIMIRNKP